MILECELTIWHRRTKRRRKACKWLPWRPCLANILSLSPTSLLSTFQSKLEQHSSSPIPAHEDNNEEEGLQVAALEALPLLRALHLFPTFFLR